MTNQIAARTGDPVRDAFPTSPGPAAKAYTAFVAVGTTSGATTSTKGVATVNDTLTKLANLTVIINDATD